MKKYRYGKFKIRDHLILVVNVLMFLLFSTISAILNLSLLFILTPLVYAIIELLVVCLPFREKFVINDSSIDTFKGKNKNHNGKYSSAAKYGKGGFSPFFRQKKKENKA